MESFVLKGAICFSTGPRSWQCLEQGYVVCEAGVCQGAFRELPGRFQALPLMNFSEKLIVPGLVDLHLHAPQFPFRGLGMDLELMDWLNTHTFPEEAKYANPDYALVAYSQFAEVMRRSCTTRAAIFATAHTRSTLLLMELMEETGMITYVGRVNMDCSAPPELREPDADSSIRETRMWLEQTEHFQRTKPILTPRFVPSCSHELMTELGNLAHRRKLPVQSHLSESPGEIRAVMERFPQASCYGGVYEQFGLLDAPGGCIMAHCVHSGPREQELLKKRGVYIAHSPESNMNLSSGVAPIRQYLDAGLHVGLATDVAAGCSVNLFKAMAHAVQVSKLRWRLLDNRLAPLTFQEAFYLATLGGGSFFGKVGSFLEGYAFDALVLDDRDFPTVLGLSVAERVERLAYLSNQSCLEAKFVGGRRIF